jgi:hypothetical protein
MIYLAARLLNRSSQAQSVINRHIGSTCLALAWQILADSYSTAREFHDGPMKLCSKCSTFQIIPRNDMAESNL